MADPAQIDGQVPPVHGIAGGSALALLESVSPGLTPAQRELRQMVLDSVPTASSKLAYGPRPRSPVRLFGRLRASQPGG